MSSFEDLQAKKVVSASGLAQKLVVMRDYLFSLKQTGQDEKYTEYLNRYAAALEELLDLVREQKKGCRHDQCNTLLYQEISELTSAINHIGRVAGSREELDESKVREALATITSHQHSLAYLLKNDRAA